MAQKCGFFNAKMEGEEFDRKYLAEDFAEYFAAFIGNGVYGHSMQKLQVICQESPDMSVKVLSGEAYINGWWYKNTDEYNISIPVADGVLSRIDVIVVRWGNIERDMWLELISGIPSNNPIKPNIRRDADYYDLQLATISVTAGSVKILQSQISDTRLDNSVCGLVTGVVDQIDTTELYNQFEAYFQNFKDVNEADFNEWFENIKEKLSEESFGNLQLELAEQKQLLENMEENKVSKSGDTMTGELCNTADSIDARKTFMDGNQFGIYMPPNGFAGGMKWVENNTINGNDKYFGYYRNIQNTESFFYMGDYYNNANGILKLSKVIGDLEGSASKLGGVSASEFEESDMFLAYLAANSNNGPLCLLSQTVGDTVTTNGRSGINSKGVKSLIFNGCLYAGFSATGNVYGGHIVVTTDGTSWEDNDTNDNYGMQSGTGEAFTTPAGNTVYMKTMAGTWNQNGSFIPVVANLNGVKHQLRTKTLFRYSPYSLKWALELADFYLFNTNIGLVTYNGIQFHEVKIVGSLAYKNRDLIEPSKITYVEYEIDNKNITWDIVNVVNVRFTGTYNKPASSAFSTVVFNIIGWVNEDNKLTVRVEFCNMSDTVGVSILDTIKFTVTYIDKF